MTALYQSPPLRSSVAGILLRVPCNFVADGAKTDSGFLVDTPRRGRLRVALSGSCFAVTGKSRGFARSGALGLPGAGHGLEACPGVDLSKPEWCFVRCLQFGQYLEELTHGVSSGHADILVLEHEVYNFLTN